MTETTPKFEITSSVLADNSCDVTAIAIRKTGPNDDKVLAITISLESLLIGSRTVADLLCMNEPDVDAMFFDPFGDPKMLGLDFVASSMVVSHVRVRIERAISMSDASISRIRITPLHPGVYKASMRVSVRDPEPGVVATISEYIRENVNVHIERLQGSLLETSHA